MKLTKLVLVYSILFGYDGQSILRIGWSLILGQSLLNDIVIGGVAAIRTHPDLQTGAQSKAHKQDPRLANITKSIPIEQFFPSKR